MDNEHRKQTILVVDDTPENIDILVSLLSADYKIKIAVNGNKALDILHSQILPDLILLDIMMPGIDGYEVCRRIKEQTSTSNIPVIFITVLSDLEDEEKGLLLGAVDYISKPFSPSITLARIKNHLELKQARDNLEKLVAERTQELEKAYLDLKDSQEHMLHKEKLAAIGQLAAGIAHEINSPTSFISSNIETLDKYLGNIETFIESLSVELEENAAKMVKQLRQNTKLDIIMTDVRDLVNECRQGNDRIKKIAMGLKNFSRKDQDDYASVNINNCLDETLKIIWNELKYKVTVVKDFAVLPDINCIPQQLSQVFMNLILNASHAIELQGVITIRTRCENDSIIINISDTGCGIPKENINKIFEAFFTTKGLGKGSGLGLSIASDIIKKHKGSIDVKSDVGKGTTFTIKLPVLE